MPQLFVLCQVPQIQFEDQIVEAKNHGDLP